MEGKNENASAKMSTFSMSIFYPIYIDYLMNWDEDEEFNKIILINHI